MWWGWESIMSSYSSPSGRRRLAADLTLFFDGSAGSDSNDGLAAGAGHAFQTLQHAWDYAADNLDLAGKTLTIQAAGSQTYTNAGLQTQKPMVGQAAIDSVVLDLGNTSSAIFNRTDGGYNIHAGNGPLGLTAIQVRFKLQNAKLQSSGASGGGGILADDAQIILGANMNFGALTGTNTSHMKSFDPASIILITADYTISGGAPGSHVIADYGRLAYQNNGVANINVDGGSGAWVFGTFAVANDFGHLYADFATFVNCGSITGRRFQITDNANINASATSATFFPGDVAGFCDGGFYGGVNGTIQADNARAGMLGEFATSIAPKKNTTVTITIASPAVITWTAHGFLNSVIEKDVVPLVFTTTGALPTGITAGTLYFVIPSSIATNTFQIATSVANALAGTAVNTSGSQSGTHTGTTTVPLTTDTFANITGISLSAGDWDVSGIIWYGGNVATTVNYLYSAISTTSASGASSITGSDSIATSIKNGATIFTISNESVRVGPTRLSLASTTTVFLVALSGFGVNTEIAWGSIRARRVR